jgi:beta-galactosidase
MGWSNERGYASNRIPGMGLWEIMGCRETAVQTGARGRTSLRWADTEIPGLTPGDVLPARWYEETLEPLSRNARVVARFPGGAPAAVISSYGKGKTLMLGSYVSAAYETSPTPEVERFYAGLLTWAGVAPPVGVTGGNLEVRTLEAGPDTLLFVFNHGKQAADASVRIQMPPGAHEASDLVEERPVQVTRSGAFLDLKKSLDASAAWVVRLTRR